MGPQLRSLGCIWKAGELFIHAFIHSFLVSREEIQCSHDVLGFTSPLHCLAALLPWAKYLTSLQ